MIKVGQIYELPISKGRVIVTKVENIKKDKRYDFIYFINNYGLQERLWRISVEETLKLVAEYDTWQQAVNSKEFNDVEIHN